MCYKIFWVVPLLSAVCISSSAFAWPPSPSSEWMDCLALGSPSSVPFWMILSKIPREKHIRICDLDSIYIYKGKGRDFRHGYYTTECTNIRNNLREYFPGTMKENITSFCDNLVGEGLYSVDVFGTIDANGVVKTAIASFAHGGDGDSVFLSAVEKNFKQLTFDPSSRKIKFKVNFYVVFGGSIQLFPFEIPPTYDTNSSTDIID